MESKLLKGGEEIVMGSEWSNAWILKGTYLHAREQFRRALKVSALEVCFESDLAAVVRSATGVRLTRTCVFGVTCPFQMLEALVCDREVSLFLPLHVVVSEDRECTHILTVSSTGVRKSGVTPMVAMPIHRTLVLLNQALEIAGATRVLPGVTAGPQGVAQLQTG